MCGITGYWAKEANISIHQYDVLLKGCTQRGDDGIGISIIHPDKRIIQIQKSTGNYTSNKDSILNFIKNHMEKGSILLAYTRATPETENETSYSMLQPVIKDNLILIHNGGVTDSMKKEVENYQFITDIDSEIILAFYEKYNRNMKETMENISGSFAFLLYDLDKNKLYSVNSFNPLAHMYIKGYGYFLHSDNGILSSILFSISKQIQDGVNVWESWYHHYLEGYTIIETDINSGFQFKQNYIPRSIYPNWDYQKVTNKKKTLVCASGGIDSGLTAWILKLAGQDVEMIHFRYGQKASFAEEWAVKRLASALNMGIKTIDLHRIFSAIGAGGMLIDKNIEINSGGDLIKSPICWVSNRNGIFASLLLGMAESYILNQYYDKVNISAGWSQLSEEVGNYVDNSFKFNETLNEFKNYSCIVGHRINFLPVLRNLTKTEEWILGSALGFPFQLTCSCDNAIVQYDSEIEDYIPILCVECGSTKLSMIAADRADIVDPRRFNHKRAKLADPKPNPPSVISLINRLLLTEEEKNILKGRIKQNDITF